MCKRMSGTSAACVCGPYSLAEYLAPLERQLAGEAALTFVPTAVLAVIAEYMAPRLLLVLDELLCVVTRAPCALFSSAPPRLGTAVRPGVFPHLHKLSMPLRCVGAKQDTPTTSSLAYLAGAAAFSDTSPGALQRPGVGAGADLRNARRCVWLRASERVPLALQEAGDPMRHESWALVAATTDALGDCEECPHKRRATKQPLTGSPPPSSSSSSSLPPRDFQCVSGGGGGGGEEKEGRPRHCGLHWRAGPVLFTLYMQTAAVRFAESLVTATVISTGDNSAVVSSLALRNSLAAPAHPFPALVASACGAALGAGCVVGGRATGGDASPGAEWDAYPVSRTADSEMPSVTRALAWGERLYLYSFRGATSQNPQLRLYVKDSTPAGHGGAAWTTRRTTSVTYVPDLFVVAPADKSGEARILALGGEHRFPRGRRDVIAVADDPLSEWTIRDWRLPFSARCAAAAFADDWLYVVGVHSGSWATRWTPHHEGWTGPDWIRMRAGYTNDSAALVVL